MLGFADMNEARADWNSKVKIFHEKRNSLKQEKSAKNCWQRTGYNSAKEKSCRLFLPIYGLTETLFLYKS
jgi:hypothetical protein